MTEPAHNLTPPSTIADTFRERARRLAWLRADPRRLAEVKAYYRDHWIDFINDWGTTVDPRNAEKKLPTVIPFSLWPIQREYLQFVLDRWQASEYGLIEKSRDMGVSWLAMALSCTMCLPDIGRHGISIGFGSAKEDKVDRAGDPDSLFYKGAAFMMYLPHEFRGDWDVKKNKAHMRMSFPLTEGSITGEAGDNIGRGGRKSIYFVDEAAHIERPLLIDASLSATVNCRIDMSSVNGSANPFAIKRHSGKVPVFTMHWRSDPRKNDDWYRKFVDTYGPVVAAQELDLNYNASQEGIIIPSEWVQGAVNAHEKLGIKPSGLRLAALDVADRGVDKNAWGYRYGVLLSHLESWSGKESDIYATAERAFLLCDEHKVAEFLYDGDGLGAGVRGDARKINEAREKAHTDRTAYRPTRVNEFRGSAGVMFPEQKVLGPDGKPLNRTNEDMFANYKAQGWWSLRFRFQQTHRALQGLPYQPANIISISKDIPELTRLLMELSQPVYKINNAGKILVDKLPDGALSPNLADVAMMLFAPRRAAMAISDALLEQI